MRIMPQQIRTSKDGTIRERTAANELQNRCSTAELNRRIGTTCALPFPDRRRGIRRCVSCGGCLVFLVRATRDNHQRIIRQRTLQRLRLIPRCAHPDVAFLLCKQDDRHGLRVDRFDDRIRRSGEKAIDVMWAWYRLRLGAPVAFELGPDTRKIETSGRSSLNANQTTSFFWVSGLGSARTRRSC